MFLEVSDDQNGGNYSGAQFKADLIDNAVGAPSRRRRSEGWPPFAHGRVPNWVSTAHRLKGRRIRCRLRAHRAARADVDADRCDPGGVRTAWSISSCRSFGGLRFPICDPSGTTWSQNRHQGVENAEIACDFPIPEAPRVRASTSRIFLATSPGGRRQQQHIQRCRWRAVRSRQVLHDGGGETSSSTLPADLRPIQADIALGEGQRRLHHHIE